MKNLEKLLMALFCALVLVSCGGDDEEGGGGEDNLLARHLSVKNVSAHYVGDAVIVDFQLENKSKKNITDLSLSVEGKDDNTIWYHFDDNFISTGEGQPFMSYLNDFTIAAHETRDMRVCFTGSTLQVGVKKFTIKLSGNSAQMGMTTYTNQSISFTTNVTDNRKSQNTIWTNDDNMSYDSPTIQRSGDNLLLSFSVTNNTGVDLADTHLYVSHLDNGNGVNFNADLFVEDVKQANYFMDITINAGETRRLNIYVPNFFKYQARCVNATINMTSKSYYFANKNLFLVSIDQ